MIFLQKILTFEPHEKVYFRVFLQEAHTLINYIYPESVKVFIECSCEAISN